MPEKSPGGEDVQAALRKLINSGAQIAGGAVAGALGFVALGPIEATVLGASGAAAAAAFQLIGQEVSQRLLGPREQARIGGVWAMAVEEIQKRVEQGESVRSDAFFESEATERSEAEEVIENVLLKCRVEPEEKKLPFMARLLAEVAFDHSINAELAHLLIKLAGELTYRQFCTLKLSVVKDRFGLRQSTYRGYGSFTRELLQLLYECHDLYLKGLINFGGTACLGVTDVNPGAMTLQGLGAELYNTMKLKTILDQDLAPIVHQLKK